MFEKIKLQICNILALRGILFFKSSSGLDLFYPWGYPGEAYYLDKRQKKIFLFFVLQLFMFLAGFCASIIIFDRNAVSLLQLALIQLAVAAIVGSIVYILGVYFFTRKMTPYVVPKQNRPNKNLFVIDAIIVVQLAMISVTLSDYFIAQERFLAEARLFAIIAAALIQLGFCSAIIKINKTRRGHFFRN